MFARYTQVIVRVCPYRSDEFQGFKLNMATFKFNVQNVFANMHVENIDAK